MAVQADLKMLHRQAALIRNNAENAAIFSDFDGTLSTIGLSPTSVIIPPETVEYLKIISERFALLGFVSGRPVGDLKNIIGIDEAIYIGNHGLEVISGTGIEKNITDEDYFKIRQAFEIIKKEIIFNEKGIFIEDKNLSVSVHYRGNPALETGILAEVNRIASSLGLKTLRGRKVIEIRPNSDADKGTAILDELSKSEDILNAVYMGDDITDFYAFRSLRQWAKDEGKHCVNIGIQSSETDMESEKSVDLVVDGPEQIVEFLKELAS